MSNVLDGLEAGEWVKTTRGSQLFVVYEVVDNEILLGADDGMCEDGAQLSLTGQEAEKLALVLLAAVKKTRLA